MAKKLLFIFLAVGFFLQITAPGSINAQTDPVIQDKGITISPIRFEYDADPGQVITGQLKFYNSTFADKTIYLTMLNFKSDGVSGTPLFYTQDTPFTASLKDWMSVDKPSFGLKKIDPNNPHVEVITFTIKVPQNAEPGGHYAGVIASEFKPEDIKINKGNIAFKDERAAIFIVNVKGDVSRNLSVDKFYATDAFTKQKDAIHVFEWMPVAFLTDLRNSGNGHTVPLGNILIYSGDQKIDSIDFNPDQGNILRESSRTYVDTWKGSLIEFSPLTDSQGNPKVDDQGNIQTHLKVNLDQIKNIRFGRYNAKLAVGYDDNGQKKSVIADYEFWVIPWKLILIVILIIVIFVGYKIWRRKQKKAKHSKPHSHS